MNMEKSKEMKWMKGRVGNQKLVIEKAIASYQAAITLRLGADTIGERRAVLQSALFNLNCDLIRKIEATEK